MSEKTLVSSGNANLACHHQLVDLQKMRIAALTFQRDELLAALIKLDRLHRGLEGWHEDATADAWVKARAAIEKATVR